VSDYATYLTILDDVLKAFVTIGFYEFFGWLIRNARNRK